MRDRHEQISTGGAVGVGNADAVSGTAWKTEDVLTTRVSTVATAIGMSSSSISSSFGGLDDASPDLNFCFH